MLVALVFLPLATALAVLALPAGRPRAVRWTTLAGALATLGLAGAVAAAFEVGSPGLQLAHTSPWIPSLGASFHLAVDGISLPLVLLTAVLLAAVALYLLGRLEPPREAARVKGHAALLLLMATGLLGVFTAQDLLLFYLFFEVALVPMYFLIALWGHEDRRYAAIKFFLYTRAGSLLMLLGILALYLASDPRTFSLPEIVAARPLAGPAALWAFLALVTGFAVKLPAVPLHNWLPDAHVEAPTEGSVVLAGLQLKMGAYGILRIALPALPEAAREAGWWLLGAGVLAMVWGALAALAQRDLKRLVAYTSINHMGYVLLAAGVWGLATSGTVRALGMTGAVFQTVSHGLLTGALFFLAGLLGDAAGTRDVERLGGLLGRLPGWGLLFAVAAFGSLGLPGLSGFVAEFQVLGATLAVSPWMAGGALLGLAVMTGLFLWTLSRLLLGEAPDDLGALARPPRRELLVVAALLALSVLLGVFPALLEGVIAPTAAALAGLPGPAGG